jgi:hypothetical protein
MLNNTNRSFALRPLIFAGLLGLAGCIAHGQVVAGADLDAPHFVFVEPPMLVAIQPGVWVVRDYRAQIFFVGDAYWHVSGGVWYRADFYDGGWIAVSTVKVPLQIRSIDEARYVHFEGEAGAARRARSPARPRRCARPFRGNSRSRRCSGALRQGSGPSQEGQEASRVAGRRHREISLSRSSQKIDGFRSVPQARAPCAPRRVGTRPCEARGSARGPPPGGRCPAGRRDRSAMCC